VHEEISESQEEEELAFQKEWIVEEVFLTTYVIFEFYVCGLHFYVALNS